MATKALFNLVPGGGALAEVFGFVVAPSLERRRDEWLRHLANDFDHLAAIVEQFDATELTGDESFVSVLIEASRAALATHQQEKLDALRNAVVNCAAGIDLDENRKMWFISLIERFRPLHLRLLTFFNDPKAWCERAGTLLLIAPKTGNARAALHNAMPELREQEIIYDPIILELHQQGLFGVESIEACFPSDLGRSMTGIGREFLAFISSPVTPPRP